MALGGAPAHRGGARRRRCGRDRRDALYRSGAPGHGAARQHAARGRSGPRFVVPHPRALPRGGPAPGARDGTDAIVSQHVGGRRAHAARRGQGGGGGLSPARPAGRGQRPLRRPRADRCRARAGHGLAGCAARPGFEARPRAGDHPGRREAGHRPGAPLRAGPGWGELPYRPEAAHESARMSRPPGSSRRGAG